jgi:hypothetical protein
MESESFKKIKSMLLEINRKEKKELIDLIITMEGESILNSKIITKQKTEKDLEGFYKVAKFYFNELPPLNVLQKTNPNAIKNMEEVLNIIDDYCLDLEKSILKKNKIKIKILKIQKHSIYNLFFQSIKIHFENFGIPFLFNTVLKHKNNFRKYIDNLFPDYSSSDIAYSLIISKRPKA